jgi:hypothetical protein
MAKTSILLALRFDKLVDDDDEEEFDNDCKTIPCLPIPISNSIQSFE